MTDKQCMEILTRDYKYKYERCHLLTRVKKINTFEIFANTYTAKEIKPIFENMVKNEFKQVKKMLESFNCYKNLNNI